MALGSRFQECCVENDPVGLGPFVTVLSDSPEARAPDVGYQSSLSFQEHLMMVADV